MPSLPQEAVDDLIGRLRTYLNPRQGVSDPIFVASGGSAAVFSVETEHGLRAFKVFAPRFLEGPGAIAERRRLDLQHRLIGHNCASLVELFGVEEAEGTAFIEMEYISWPSLVQSLAQVPDEAVAPLLKQLVVAIRFLEALNVVHRDIKPENIHVSPEFNALKLVDLGVARPFDLSDADEGGQTDRDNLRPFLATAQYSSPEYLFRLDPPTPHLWKGLSIYQVGAVLHDLIMKEPLFQEEILMGNRWLVARAVLTTAPSFADVDPLRLAGLKALAARCLTKELESRLQLVDWADFDIEAPSDALAALKSRLTKQSLSSSAASTGPYDTRLEFARKEFERRFVDRIRSEMIMTCGARLPLTVRTPGPSAAAVYQFVFATPYCREIVCPLSIEWLDDLYARAAGSA